MVLCCEWDTMYADLPNTALRYRVSDDWTCPKCNAPIKDITGHPDCRISFDEWSNAGLDALLDEPTLDDLVQMMAASADQIADYLRRGMRSTAKMQFLDFRNLAESIAHHFSAAMDSRIHGAQLLNAGTLRNAIEQCDSIADPIHRDKCDLTTAAGRA